MQRVPSLNELSDNDSMFRCFVFGVLFWPRDKCSIQKVALHCSAHLCLLLSNRQLVVVFHHSETILFSIIQGQKDRISQFASDSLYFYVTFLCYD
jgi:hypothetical protein